MMFNTDILAIGAHPDDVEFGCGGILAKMADQGKSIAIVSLTLGEKGTHGTTEIRRKEGQAAAEIIGAECQFLNFQDCEIYDTFAGRLELVKVIRHYRPKLVLAPFWHGEQNHPDHLACGQMARYACRYARFSKILPEIPVFTPQGILHYMAPMQITNADFIIDISDYIETWKSMMNCHKSQMKTFDYAALNMRAASMYGVLIGKPYAQGLCKGNPIEIDDIMSISKGVVSL